MDDILALIRGETTPTLAESLVLKPPTVLLIGLLVAAALHFGVSKLRAFKVRLVNRLVLGLLLIAWGAHMVYKCVLQMKTAQTAPSHVQPTTVLLRSGLYSFTRNPLYVGGGESAGTPTPTPTPTPTLTRRRSPHRLHTQLSRFHPAGPGPPDQQLMGAAESVRVHGLPELVRRPGRRASHGRSLQQGAGVQCILQRGAALVQHGPRWWQQ